MQCWRMLYWPSEHLLPTNPALSSWISNSTSASKELAPRLPGSKTYKTFPALLHPPCIGPISIDDEWWDRRPMLGEISTESGRSTYHPCVLLTLENNQILVITFSSYISQRAQMVRVVVGILYQKNPSHCRDIAVSFHVLVRGKLS